MENKKRLSNKGLSTVVTTLIMVLLVLVAIVIIWVVIRGIIEGGGKQSDALTRCNLIDLKIQSVSGCTPSGCTGVIVKRNAGADSNDISGVRVVLRDAIGNSIYGDTDANIPVLGTQNLVPFGGYGGGTLIGGVSTVEVAAIVSNAGGDDQICSLTDEFVVTTTGGGPADNFPTISSYYLMGGGAFLIPDGGVITFGETTTAFLSGSDDYALTSTSYEIKIRNINTGTDLAICNTGATISGIGNTILDANCNHQFITGFSDGDAIQVNFKITDSLGQIATASRSYTITP